MAGQKMKRPSHSLKLAAGYCVAVLVIATFAEISGGLLWAFIIYGATYPSSLLVDRQVIRISETVPVWVVLTGVTFLNAVGIWLLTETVCRAVRALRQNIPLRRGQSANRQPEGAPGESSPLSVRRAIK